ncbi:MAG: hypothetical protein QME66_03040 [Candidatus Eisenbacteria bacterium]|nr:hypothetical protein [Candidatus Eisenbacteria bacterium]
MIERRSSLFRYFSLIIFSIPFSILVSSPRAFPQEPHRSGGLFIQGEDSSILARLSGLLADSIFQEDRTTSLSSVGLRVTNFGIFGNNLATRAPSMEYPLGSGIEHLVRAGLWVGGFNTDIGETLVTAGTFDGYWLGPLNSTTEFTPVPHTTLLERSTLPGSKYYDPVHAISEQDFVARYSDSPSFVKSVGEAHRSLGIEVTQETYAWSFEPSDAFIMVRFFIKNVCGPGCYLKNVYVGLYSQFASGWKGAFPTWPPSGWFRKTDIDYLAERNLFMEHHYLSERGDAATSWAGLQLLTRTSSPTSDTTQQVSFNWWQWDPNGAVIMPDRQRYSLISNGEIDGTTGVEAQMLGPDGNQYSPCGVLTVGPFQEIAPDSMIVLSFAFVAGDNNDDLIKNAKWALEVARSGFVTYTPPPSPRMKVIPQKGQVTVRWDDSPESYVDPKSHRTDFEGYRIYISEDNLNFNLVKELDIAADTIGYNSGLLEAEGDPVVIDGVPYKYRLVLTNLKDGFKYWVGTTAFDTGEVDSSGKQMVESKESGLAFNRTMVIPGPPERLSRVSVFPNPYRGRAVWDGSLSRDKYIWFVNVPRRALINIYSLAGDLIDTIDFDSGSYAAGNARGVINPGGEVPRAGEAGAPELSGTMCAWDLITKHDQAVASGLYIFSVKNLETGEVEMGKFLVIK